MLTSPVARFQADTDKGVRATVARGMIRPAAKRNPKVRSDSPLATDDYPPDCQ